MAQISIIFVSVIVAVISLSEAAQFGLFPPQMRLPGFGMMNSPSEMMFPMMMNQMMFPWQLPKPSRPSKPIKPPKLPKIHDLILEQMKAEAQQMKFMMEQQRLMQEAIASQMAALVPQAVVTSTTAEVKPSTHTSSKSKSKSKSRESKELPKLPGQMGPNTPPGSNFQSVSYSTSHSSSNINGVPSSSTTGHVTINDNGKVTTKVF